MNSWKTTIFGLMALIGGGIIAAYNLDPEMVAALPKWVKALGFLLSTIGAGGVGIVARDNNKSSEDVGAKPSAVPVRTLSLLLAASLAGALVGCQAPPSRIAYNSVAAPAVAVSQAMKAWGDYVAQFHPSAATELKVKAAFERYQAAELLAIDAARAYADLSAGGATGTLAARAQAELTSRTATNALADLVGLLQQLGVKL
jgi:hypothetical protein